MNETILLGWQADVNLFRRLSGLHGAEARYRAEQLFRFHRTHTRNLTPARATDVRRKNAVRAYEVTRPDLRNQRKRWGLRKTAVEEISLRPGPTHVTPRALKSPLLRHPGRA